MEGSEWTEDWAVEEASRFIDKRKNTAFGYVDRLLLDSLGLFELNGKDVVRAALIDTVTGLFREVNDFNWSRAMDKEASKWNARWQGLSVTRCTVIEQGWGVRLLPELGCRRMTKKGEGCLIACLGRSKLHRGCPNTMEKEIPHSSKL